jgi:hypothetical protein
VCALVGREDERARLTALLDGARVLLVHGPAGLGQSGERDRPLGQDCRP